MSWKLTMRNPKTNPMSPDFERALLEQRLCVEYILSDGTDKRGVWQGLSDWVAEELLIGDEARPPPAS